MYTFNLTLSLFLIDATKYFIFYENKTSEAIQVNPNNALEPLTAALLAGTLMRRMSQV